jgi:hypothetical protein
MLQAPVVGAANGGCLCYDRPTIRLQATFTGAAEDIGDATSGRRCCNEPATVLPSAFSVATRR